MSATSSYYKRNRKPRLKYQKAYDKSHNKQIKNYHVEYYKQPQIILKTSKYYKKYQKENPDKGLKASMKYLKNKGEIFSIKPAEYKRLVICWSLTIKKLDNYMCKNCDSTENLHAHHIKPRKLFPKLSFKLNNGVTLCKKCHMLVHK